MPEHLRAVSPLSLVLAQAQSQEVLCLLADVLPLEGGDVQFFVHYLIVDFLRSCAEEGQLFAEENVDDDCGGPDVDLVVVPVLHDHLGGHVVNTAEDLAELEVMLEGLCEAEVNDLKMDHLVIDIVNHDVVRFDVPMSNLLVVKELEKTVDLPRYMLYIFFFHGAQLILAAENDVVEKVSILDQIRNNEVKLIVVK